MCDKWREVKREKIENSTPLHTVDFNSRVADTVTHVRVVRVYICVHVSLISSVEFEKITSERQYVF